MAEGDKRASHRALDWLGEISLVTVNIELEGLALLAHSLGQKVSQKNKRCLLRANCRLRVLPALELSRRQPCS